VEVDIDFLDANGDSDAVTDAVDDAYAAMDRRRANESLVRADDLGLRH
jgi:hypothetical protein